jgi:cystathionine beta-lyase
MTQKTGILSNDLVQLGRSPKQEPRQVNFPVKMGSTVVFDTLSAFEKARDQRYDSGTLYYGRYGNSASFELEALLAVLALKSVKPPFLLVTNPDHRKCT